MIWRTRPGSASASGIVGATNTPSCWPFSSKRGRISSTISCTASPTSIGRQLDVDPVGLDPGHVEQVVDELHQALGRAGDDVDELPLAVGQALRGAREQLDEPLDRGQRAAELVRGHRHEVGLRPLQARALADVAQRPHRPLAGAAELRRGDRQRAAVVLDRLLARRAPRASGGSGLSAHRRSHRPDRSSGSSSVARGLTVAIRVDPGSVTSRPSPRLSIVVASRRRSSSTRGLGGDQLLAHRVERSCRAPAAHAGRRRAPGAGADPKRDRRWPRRARRADPASTAISAAIRVSAAITPSAPDTITTTTARRDSECWRARASAWRSDWRAWSWTASSPLRSSGPVGRTSSPARSGAGPARPPAAASRSAALFGSWEASAVAVLTAPAYAAATAGRTAGAASRVRWRGPAR